MQRLLEGDPSNALMYQYLAGLYCQQNNLESAIENYEMAVTLDPSLSYSQRKLANMYLVQQHFEAADYRFQEALKLKLSAILYIDYSLLLIRTNRVNEAIRYLKLVIEDQTCSNLVYREIEKELLDNYLKQEITENKALIIKPIYMAYYLLIKIQPEERDQLIRTLAKLIENKPTALGYRLLSYLHQSLGDEDQAETYQGLAMSLDDKSVETETTEGLLRHGMFAANPTAGSSADPTPDLSGQKNNGR